MNDTTTQPNDAASATPGAAANATPNDAAGATPGAAGFAALGLGPEVLRALADMGFSEPTPVQAAALPVIVSGRDLMAQSRTGSGKTAAFGIPLVDRVVKTEDKHVQAIVLLPTRELALQVAAELARVAAHSGLSVVPIYGGAPMGRQVEQLAAGAHIVCGTPGRVQDHMRQGTLKLDRVKCAILDECDEMLSMGFQEDIEAILEKTPAERQTLLFSATVPEGIQRLARRFLRNPETLKLSADFVGVHEIRHVYYFTPGGQREAELLRVLEFENPERGIVFCNTREETGRVAEYLRRNGYDAEAISSDLSQSDRERVMGLMRAKALRFLVATDVAARGIDLDALSHVINYNFPESPEVYIHRTGRTGRAGKHGTAISLIGPSEVGALYYVKLLYKIVPEERSLPSEAEVRSKREGERIVALRAMFPDAPGAAWASLARRLMGATDAEHLVGGLLERAFAQGVAPAEPARAETGGATARPRTEEPAGTSAGRGDRGREDDRGRGRGERTYGRGRDGDRPRDRFREGGRGRRDDRGGYGRRDDRGGGRRSERDRGENPTSRAASAPTAGDGRDFWEVWSEDVGRSPSSTAGAGGPSPAPASQERPSETRNDGPSGAGAAPMDPGPGQVRLYLNLGRRDRLHLEDIAALLEQHGASVAREQIQVMSTHSYINIDVAAGEKLCQALTGTERDGRRLACEPARPRGSR